jgi:DNA-binding transcriptional ArsR family regulator
MTEIEAEKILKALANRRRLQIIKLLKKKKKAMVGDIANTIKLSFTATSKHLGVLYSAGIVDREQKSLQMWYGLSPTPHSIVKHISNSIE